jgi:hypothetical protein
MSILLLIRIKVTLLNIQSHQLKALGYPKCTANIKLTESTAMRDLI